MAQVLGDRIQGQPVSRTGGVLHREAITKEAVVSFQSLDHEKVEGKPQRAPPVGVAAKHPGGGLGRFVVDRGAHAFDVELVRVIQVKGGNRPQTVGGQELLLVEQLGEYPLEPFGADNSKEKLAVARFPVEEPGLRQLVRVVEPLVAE